MVDNRCPNCGKGLAHGVFIDSDRAIELPCSCEPAPDALTLILLEMRAIRALLEGRSGQYIPKDMLATVHEGNAVVPSATYCPATGQFTLPPDPYQRDAVGAVTGLAPKDPEASAAPASQSVEMPGEVASPSYPPAASSL